MTQYSQNGWVANDPHLIVRKAVPGTNVSLAVREGDASTVMIWVASFFNTYIEPISTRHGVKGFDVADDWGYAARLIRGSSTVISNHASGTAVDLNATRHPRGVAISHTFTRTQIGLCHEIESLSGGVIRWGGSYGYPTPPDGMHFEINRGSASVTYLAAKIRAGKVKGSWVGFPNAPVPTPGPKPPTGEAMYPYQLTVGSGAPLAIPARQWAFWTFQTAFADTGKAYAKSAYSLLAGRALGDLQLVGSIGGLKPGVTVLNRAVVVAPDPKTKIYVPVKVLSPTPSVANAEGVAYINAVYLSLLVSDASQHLRAEIAIDDDQGGTMAARTAVYEYGR